MPLIPFPNIPALPGVPSLPRLPGAAAIVSAGLGVIQGLLWRTFQTQTRWGVFDSAGNPLGDPAKFTGLIGDALDAVGLGSTMSTRSVDYSKETRVSDFPIERGSFASYNKVETPASPVVTLCLTGSENNRRTFLDAIDAACKSTDLYSVATPEVTYIEYSIERYNYRRSSAKGATLLMVELTLKEIRQVSSEYTQASDSQVDQPQDVGATPEADGGKVQPQIPGKSTLKAISDKFPSLADTVSSFVQGLVN